MKSLATILFVLAFTLPVHAQQGLDIVRQDIELDMTGLELVGTMTIELHAEQAASAFWLLEPIGVITSITVDDLPVTTSENADYPAYVDDVPLALAAGETAVLRVAFAGTPACGAAPNAVCAYDDQLALLLSPQGDPQAWYAMNLGTDDTFVGQIRVRAREGWYVVAGQGAPVAMETGTDSTVSWTYAYETPASMLFVYARPARELAIEGPTPVRGYIPLDADAAEEERFMRSMQMVTELLPIYEARFGALPIDEVHLMTVEPRFPFGGMGLLGDILLGDFLLWEDYEYLIEQGIAHELAHSWWGNLASPSDRDEATVLNEGIAEYSAWLALGETRGDDVRTAGARMSSVWYMYGRPGDADVAPLAPEAAASPVFIHVSYHKGSQAWRTIAEAAGEDGFASALRTLADAGTPYTVADLLSALESATGYDASRDVDEWLRSAGFPRITVGTTTRGDQLCFTIDVEGDFHLALPIAVRDANGDAESSIVSVATGANEYCVPAIAALGAVEIDPRWTMTREVRPALEGDVTFDGRVDAADLIEVALHAGGQVPAQRRIDGHYDPLFDLDANRSVDADDLATGLAIATR